MRKVSKLAALSLFSTEPFAMGNTTVTVTSPAGMDPYATMFLHGNRIAEYCKAKDHLELSYAGWQTMTTRERLNAITELYNGERPFHSKDGYRARTWIHWER